MLKDNLRDYIYTALLSLNIKKQKKDIQIDTQQHSKFGDYSTNIAFLCGKNPMEFAGKIKNEILKANNSSVKDVEVAGGGFINFYLHDEFFCVKKKINKNIYKQKQNKQILVEYTDPNPFKVFHIGHLMTNIIGEAVASLYESLGYKVVRLCYQGDIGPHVSKAILGVVKKNIKTKDLSIKNIAESYAYANKIEKEDPGISEQITEITQNMYAKTMSQHQNNIYRIGKDLSMDHFGELYEILGTKFDKHFFESEVYESGTKIVLKNLKNKIFNNSDGAVIYEGKKKKLNTRVFITSKNTPTYETKEIGLYFKKIKTYPKAALSITITANEQDNFFKVVNAAIEEIIGKKTKTLNITHGIMKVTGSGKMSSREGNVISGEELLKKVIQEVSNKNPKLNKKEIETISVSAIKVGVLRQEYTKDIHFDIKKEISLTKGSGPYLLYSVVRCKGILSKKPLWRVVNFLSPSGSYVNKEILKELDQYGEILKSAKEKNSPHHLIQYLIRLSSLFNSWYAKEKIIGTKYQNQKLLLVDMVKETLEDGLCACGIKKVNRM